jgi:hypothetical protein
MNILIILLSTLSTLVVAIAVITEGKLKKAIRNNLGYKEFKSELFKVTLFGWFIIGISLLSNLGNGYLAIVNTNDNNKQLLELSNRSDSIKLAVIENAVKAMEGRMEQEYYPPGYTPGFG